MCMNPLKAAPYAIGGLLGGSALKSAFGGNKNKIDKNGGRFGGGLNGDGSMSFGGQR